MKHFLMTGLLQKTGWLKGQYVSVDDSGKILAISSEKPPGQIEVVSGYAIPGFINSHSHAFQYAMAGQAEFLRAPQDDFWSWREAMYHLALHVSPDHLEAIATMLYCEMLRLGYTAVVEFHYLHHDLQGEAYANPAEMSTRLMAAAAKAGIRLTLVPIYYRTGDFDKPASTQQRRFLHRDLDAYYCLLELCRTQAAGQDHVLVSAGLHSLRAAPPDDIRRLFNERRPGEPFHLHIAEQQREVDTCLAVLGQRPVAWLLDQVEVDETCHLVHATHLTREECRALALSGAVAVLCPSTEGNLGDGFFPLRDYLQDGGRIAIGSDSHVGLSPIEELRWLDYGQRLSLQKRNVVCQQQGEDSGRLLFEATLSGGRHALGFPQDAYFEVGTSFDAVILDPNFPALISSAEATRLSSYIYAGDAQAHLGTLVAGKWVIRLGQHAERDSILKSYKKTCMALRS